jgi:dTDP-4-amino-4,6-dideoxygalactose transaminase
MISWLDLKAQNQSIRDEVLPLWEEILNSAGFIGGKHVAGFEEEFAAACGAEHCAAVASGTDALRFIFHALGLEPGDEVILPAHTFIATSEAVSQAGGKPVFVDIDPHTYTLNPDQVEQAVTPRTRGVVAVHIYGQPADMDALGRVVNKHGLWLVEDAAQAHLATSNGRLCGSMGVAAGFSFYPGKNLGACGEAGAVTTNSAELDERIRMLRDHGQAAKYYHDIEGYNGRCDALQAAALRVKLKHLPAWTEARREHARRYAQLLAGMDGVLPPAVREGVDPVWHLYVVQVDHRDEVQARMKEKGVATGLHYPVPLHLQKAYAHLGHSEGDFPVTEALCRRLLTLPMYPELASEDVESVCRCLEKSAAEAAEAAASV